MKKNYCLLLLIFLSFCSTVSAQLTGCPSVDIDPGDVQLNTDGSISVCKTGDCVTLTANYLKTGKTDTYTVSSIPYDPPFPFTGSPNAVNLTADDQWSQIIDLGFDFCFFDQSRNKVLINDNGALTFSINGEGGVYNAGGPTGYAWNTLVPSPPPAFGGGPLYRSAIFGAMQDLYPTDSPADYSVNYEVVGSYPCRTLVFNVYNAASYRITECGGQLLNTTQIVLYEGTNIIDIYVKDRSLCMGWPNSGTPGGGVIGIQNEEGTVGFTPPDRNTGAWEAHNEAWRFTPAGDPNYNIKWFQDGELIAEGVDAIEVCPTQTTTITTTVTYTQCGGPDIVDTDTQVIKFEEPPILGIPRDLEECLVINNGANFDLTIVQPDLTTNPLYQFQYYTSEEDAEAEENAIPADQIEEYFVDFNDSPKTIWVNVKNPNTECFWTQDFDLIVQACDFLLVRLPDLFICEGEVNSFDLSQYTDVVYHGNLSYAVSYHNSEDDANTGDNPIEEPELSNYVATSGETIWVRVENIEFPSVFEITSFKLFIYPVPEIFTLTPLAGCEVPGTGWANFDLTQRITAATGGATSLEVSFYAISAEAENGNIADAFPYNYTGPGGTVYVRVYNPNTTCYSILPLVLEVKDTPIANDIGPVSYCDPNNDGHGVFNLEALKIQIAGNPIPAGIQVSFHETLSDAQNNVLPINQVVNYVNITPNAQTIYARVGYINSSCSSIVPVVLVVNKTPDVPSTLNYSVCDDNNDGLAVFDLTSQAGVILNGLNPADYTLSYHTTFDNATFDVFPISNPTAFSNLTSETVYVRVENNTTGCFRVVTLHLVVNAKPVVPNPVPTYQLCDDNHDGFMIFNLASRIPAITNNQSNLLVTFHYTAADAQNDVAPLPMNYQNAVQNVQTLHVRVENITTGCFTLTTMDIRVSPAPVLHIPAAPIAVCASGQGGFGTIDLTSYAALLLQGENYTLTFFETESNALNNQAPIQNPAQYNNLQANNPVVWVRATNPVTNCFSVYALAFKLEIAPIMPLTLPNYVSCDTVGDLFDGLTSFDLTQQSAAIIAFQPQPGNYTVRYYTSLASATAGTGWIADPTAFVNTTNPQTIWVRIDNANVLSGGCFALGSFTIEGKTALPLGTPTPIVLCNEALPNDFQTVFDLTIRELQILQGEVFEAVVTYHLTEAEARSGSNAIGNPTAYTNTSATQTIWVSVINQYGCRSVVPLTLRVLPLPEPNMTPAPLTECEIEDGEAEFNLRDAEADISNFDNNLSYEYYLTFGDAQLGNTAAALTLEEAEAFTSASTTVYVRVSTKTGIPSESCSVVVPLDLIVIPTPAVGPMTPLFVCIENAPEYYKFNLHDKDAQALAGQDASLFSVRYYLTEEDATDAINPLPYLYTNVTPTEQTIWVRVENIEHGCFAIASFNLKIEEAVKAFTPTDVTFCDVDGVNDGLTVVDLTVMSADIIGTQPVTGLQVRYYASVQNYQMGIVIGTPTAYQTVSNPQTIIAEVYNNDSNELCTATIQFDINVIDGPIMKDIPDGFICIDYRTQERTGYLMDTGLPAAGHTFVWTRNGTVVGGNTPTFTATEAGTYTVEVTVNATGCKAIQTIIVQDAPALTIDVVNLTDGFSDTNAIEVIVSGPAGYQYEYALDEGPYQEENIFMNVSPGDHTVWVRVKNQAGNEACPASLVVTVLNYPKYFTPNGDGYNDTWNIPALKNQPKSKIYIFDRQGKLLKQISPAGAGWDGTLNGKPLPSTDYWFKVEYIEPNTGLQKEATGHFSLKR
ncbi:T9SS type B sorting domain-containing protein [Paenimyroides ceti]